MKTGLLWEIFAIIQLLATLYLFVFSSLSNALLSWIAFLGLCGIYYLTNLEEEKK